MAVQHTNKPRLGNGLRESAIWRGALFLIAIDIVLGSFLWTLNLWDDVLWYLLVNWFFFFKGGIFTTALRVALFADASGAVGERRHAAPTFTKLGCLYATLPLKRILEVA